MAMNTRKRRRAEPRVRKPQPTTQRDMTVYGRVLSLPQLTGMLPLSKTEIGRDFRELAGHAPEPVEKIIVTPADVGQGAPASPRAAPAKDEKAASIYALENAVYRDYESDLSHLDLRAPSKALSGWVASRIIVEGGGSAPIVAFPGTLDASPLGMGPLRLDMSLRQRLAAVTSRREERDRRFLFLRRKYIRELRGYLLETKEQQQALEQLKDAAEEAKQHRDELMHQVSNNELAPLERDLATLVLLQNGELRARLSLITGRFSANYVDWLKDMWRKYPVAPPKNERELLQQATNATSAVATQQSPDDKSIASAEANQNTESTFDFDLSCGLLFASGDFVRTAYGDGYVERQNDATGMCLIKLCWGALAHMHCKELALLCVAGEQYLRKDIFTRCFSRDKLRQAALSPVSILDGLHSGSSSRQRQAEEDKESAHADKVTRKVRADPASSGRYIPGESQHALRNACIFRTNWRIGAQRGVELDLDPHHSSSTVGFVVGVRRPVDKLERQPVPGLDKGAGGVLLNSNGHAEESPVRRRGWNARSPDRSMNTGTAETPRVNGKSSVKAENDDVNMERLNSTDEVTSPATHLDLSHAVETPSSSGPVSRSDLGKYKAEVQRLKFQLRTAEDSRREQRRRLTESRWTISQLIYQLQQTRAQLGQLREDVNRRETDLSEATEQLRRTQRRYQEAVARGWVTAHPEVYNMSRVNGSGIDEIVKEEPAAPIEAAPSRPRSRRRGTGRISRASDEEPEEDEEEEEENSDHTDSDEEAAVNAMRGLRGMGSRGQSSRFSDTHDSQAEGLNEADDEADEEDEEEDDRSREYNGDNNAVEQPQYDDATVDDAEAIEALAAHLTTGGRGVANSTTNDRSPKALFDLLNGPSATSLVRRSAVPLAQILANPSQFVSALHPEAKAKYLYMPLTELTSVVEASDIDADISTDSASDLSVVLSLLKAGLSTNPTSRRYNGSFVESGEWVEGLVPVSVFETIREESDTDASNPTQKAPTSDSTVEEEFTQFLEQRTDLLMLPADVPEPIKDVIYMPWSRILTSAGRYGISVPSLDVARRVLQKMGIRLEDERRQLFYNGRMTRCDVWLFGMTELMTYRSEQKHVADQIASKFDYDNLPAATGSNLASNSASPGSDIESDQDSSRPRRATKRPRSNDDTHEDSGDEISASESGSHQVGSDNASQSAQSTRDEEQDDTSSAYKRRRFVTATYGGGNYAVRSQSATEEIPDKAMRRSRRSRRRSK